MSKVNKALGAHGERIAEHHLVSRGYVVVARNWRCSDGEIDLVLRDGEDLVFCEVKTRRGTGFGVPAEAVVGVKARRLRRLAARWLEQSTVRPRDVRFDVVSVLAPRGGAASVQHLRGAF